MENDDEHNSIEQGEKKSWKLCNINILTVIDLSVSVRVMS